MRALTLAGDLLQDGRFTLRQLRKNPGFTCTAVLTLALGMCASVAIFAFVDAALLRPLPYANPSRLVGVYESVPMFPQSNLSYADYRDWKTLNRSFDSLSAYQRSGMTLTAPEGAQRVPAARVSDDFFRTLGVAPVLGRDFRAGEDLPSAARTVLLSYAAWQARYGGAANVLGESVTLNGAPHVIVGVLPRHFHFAPAEPADFWVTLHASNPCDLRRSCHNLFGVARLKDGVSIESAATEMTAVAQQLEKAYPDSNRGQGASVLLLQDVIVGMIRPMLIVLLSGAGLLLVIAAVNVASLLLVRSESRRREVAIRTALGASTVRVIRQFITEAMVLVALGTVLALASAYWAVQLLSSLVPADIMAGMPFLRDLGMTPRVAAFASALAVAAAALFAITPMLQMSTADMGERLASAAVAPPATRGGASVRSSSSSNLRPRWCCSSALDSWARASTVYSEWTPGCRWITSRRSPSMRPRTVTRPTSSKPRSSGRSRTALRCCRGCSRSGPPARRRSSAATRCGSGSRAAPITVSTTRCSIER